jgi:predicted nuclease of predicted toxin-antitoxin system
VRFLVDECISRRIVQRLIVEDHDVVWIAETRPGEADGDVLNRSWSDSRILLTEDWDFGELAIRFRRPAFGIVIIAVPQFRGDLDRVAESLVRRLMDLGDVMLGKLTIMEPGRVRQRDLLHSDAG